MQPWCEETPKLSDLVQHDQLDIHVAAEEGREGGRQRKRGRKKEREREREREHTHHIHKIYRYKLRGNFNNIMWVRSAPACKCN